MIGSLRYLTSTRPDLHIQLEISRLVETPRRFTVVKRILNFVKISQDNGVFYKRRGTNLIGFSDSDWAGEAEERKITSGFAFHLETGIFLDFKETRSSIHH